MRRASANSDTPAAIANARVGVAQRIRRAVREPGSEHGGLPLVAPPVVQVQIAAALAGEERGVSSLGGSAARASAAPVAAGRPVANASASRTSFTGAVREDRRTWRHVAVDVAPLERIHSSGRSPVRPTMIGSARETGGVRRRPAQFGQRFERQDLAALRLRVRDLVRGVLVEELHPDRVVQHLPQRLHDLPGRPFRQLLPPLADRARLEPVNAKVAPPADAVAGGTVERVPQSFAEGPPRVLLARVLIQVLVDELA